MDSNSIQSDSDSFIDVEALENDSDLLNPLYMDILEAMDAGSAAVTTAKC